MSNLIPSSLIAAISNLHDLLSFKILGISVLFNVMSLIVGLPFKIAFNKEINIDLSFSSPNNILKT